jgi:hypothetical protein
VALGKGGLGKEAEGHALEVVLVQLSVVVARGVAGGEVVGEPAVGVATRELAADLVLEGGLLGRGEGAGSGLVHHHGSAISARVHLAPRGLEIQTFSL